MTTTETLEIQITAAGDEPGARSLKVEVPLPLVQQAERKAATMYAKRARLLASGPAKPRSKSSGAALETRSKRQRSAS